MGAASTDAILPDARRSVAVVGRHAIAPAGWFKVKHSASAAILLFGIAADGMPSPHVTRHRCKKTHGFGPGARGFFQVKFYSPITLRWTVSPAVAARCPGSTAFFPSAVQARL